MEAFVIRCRSGFGPDCRGLYYVDHILDNRVVLSQRLNNVKHGRQDKCSCLITVLSFCGKVNEIKYQGPKEAK